MTMATDQQFKTMAFRLGGNMNERIKELMAEARTPFNKTGSYFTQELLMEKFAELIVAECISVMNTTAKEAQENFTYMDNDVPTTAHQFEIRKHFGVKL